jgi:ABC-type transport system involved in multi-copper enzyme maturation permease subunit
LAAELFALRRRAVGWVLAAVWTVQVLGFAYLISYVTYRSTRGSIPSADSAKLLRSLLPGDFPSFIVNSLPIYGGPVLLILGAVIGSSDYRLNTLRTVLARFTDRTAFLTGRYLALCIVTLAYSLWTLVISSLGSTGVGLLERRSLAWPAATTVLAGFGSTWLIMTAFASLGFGLGLVTRSMPVAIAVGLVWTPGVENVLGLLSDSASFLRPIRTVLLSPSAGSVAAALDSAAGASTAGVPGVEAIAGPGVNYLVIACYVLVPAVISLVVFRRRDIF